MTLECLLCPDVIILLFGCLSQFIETGCKVTYFVDGMLQCEWFFSSWDEDVNVPVDEVPTDPVPISGMNELLLAKAESLGKPRASLLASLTS